MRPRESKAALYISLLAISLAFSCWCANAQTTSNPARITQAIDEKNLVTLKGNVHPLARPEFDQGPVADAQPMKRILLLLQRSPDQEAALPGLLDDQQSKSSPNYHAWLTPERFGQQFGPADADIQIVTQWLASYGFTNIKVGPGRTVMEFSGNVGQVRNAFHTEIHRYLIEGKNYTANASDPQIPAALVPVVAGIVSLHSFRPRPHVVSVGSFFRSKATGQVTAMGPVKPLFTAGSSFYPLAPADFATIYNTAPLINGSPKIDGTGQTIAIVGESDINVQDVVNFRNLFGLSQNFSSANVFVNGVDPGFNPSETESDLDVQWAGAVAPGATIDFVTSAPTETTSGVHLSAVYAVDNNLAGAISESFGQCEQQLGAAGNQFYNSLWEQAAAQGTTVILSAGDGGSAGCDNFDTQQTAKLGLAVSGFASTPFNVAVGGTDFDQFNNWSQYWNPTNDPVTQASAKGYIPEIPWNDSCAQIAITGCGASAPQGSLNIVAGSGGPSAIYSKPAWQAVTGVPNDGRRDLPDVSLFASNGFTGSIYIICQADVVNPPNPTCNLSDLGFSYQGVGGTSASAPAFAGIMALVNQKQSTQANPSPRQGVANYVLYALANKSGASCPSGVGEASACIFNDITKGNSDLPTGLPGVGTNSVPCTGGTPNCNVTSAASNGVLITPTSSTTEAWTVGTGYDMATGLGSVNAQNLVNNWSASFSPSLTTLSANVNGKAVNSISGITHGTPVSVSSSVAAGAGASGTPTGQVALLATPNPTPGNPSASLGIEALSLVSGTATSSSVVLPGGSYNLSAHYQGDASFGPSDSSPAIPVSITAEASKTLISIPVFNQSTGQETGNTPMSVVYGSPYLARIDVGNASASLIFPPQPVCTLPDCPTGTITLTDSYNGAAPAPLDGGTFPLNSAGFTEDLAVKLPGGSHVLSASYGGDNSFNASSNTYALTVTPAPTTMVAGNPPLPPQAVTPFGFNTILTTQSSGAMPSCNVTLFDGATQLPGPVQCGGFAGGATSSASLQPFFTINQAAAGTHTYNVKFTGDANYAPSNTFSMTTRVYDGTTTTVTVIPGTIQYGSSVTLTAVVDSTVSQGPPIGQNVVFNFGYPGNNPVSGTVSYTPFTDSSGNLALRASISTVPQDSGFYTATFSGDTNYAQSSSFPANLTVNIPDFSLSANLPTPSITAGNSANATITVTPLSNSASPVSLVCPPLNLLGQTQPQGISCNFSPSTVNLSNGNPQVSTLTISTLAPSSSNSTSFAPPQAPPLYIPPHPNWTLPISSVLILLIALLLPTRLRRNRVVTCASLACCLSLLSGFVGCGGGSTGGTGGGGGGGPVPTSITLTTSSVKVPSNPTSGGSVNLTANITSSNTPGGTVTFTVDGNSGWFATPTTVVAGVAQVQLTNLSVGIHTVSAQYSGDENNLGSQTKGSLNIAVTGQTGVTIQANTGGLSHMVAINFNLQ
ncbi:MAG TPA: Ig-like domain repeat protein [Candidatus Acidoferrum sp.]|nr:Ig-like domain repeat protein [Candidatus Acidoferrum sp.]